MQCIATTLTEVMTMVTNNITIKHCAKQNINKHPAIWLHCPSKETVSPSIATLLVNIRIFKETKMGN